MLKLKLLGASAIYLDDKLLTLKTNKSQALLYYLVSNQGFHSRDLLADLLWPNMNTQQARKNLRDALSQLRAHVGDYLLIDRQKLAFNHALPYQSDVHDFIDKIERGRVTTDLALVEQGLLLYQEGFLLGFHVLDAAIFDSWANQQRIIYQRYAIDTMAWLTLTYLKQHAYPAGIISARHLLKLEPWQENIHRSLMQLLALAGKQASAVRQYEICRQALESTLGIPPSVETELLYAQIKDGRFPPATDPDTTITIDTSPVALSASAVPHAETPAHASVLAHNLPRTFTPLIGRDQAVNQLQALLLDPTRPLITLVGEGGVGKTRLALAAAQALLTPAAAIGSSGQSPAPLHPFRDGIWFVDLSEISADDQTAAQIGEAIAAAIGGALNISFTRSGNLSHQVGIALRHKAALLILDNFEHLYAGVNALVDLLQMAHSVQLLITSRRRLVLAAEYLVEVTGLAVPPLPAADLSPAQLLTYSAIQFFSESAKRTIPAFQLDESNWPAVLHICWLLDGLPLGIELAATLLATYSCQQVDDQLQQHYQILSTNRADLPMRQHSMRVVLDTSWQLLAADEALILASCTLLQASFSLEAIQVTTGATPEQIRRVVHRSLLHHDMTTHRFRLHALVRQYGSEQLQAHPDTAQAAGHRHAQYFIQLLGRQQTLFNDSVQLQQVKDHWENITAAWRWSVVAERFDLLAAGAQPLAHAYHLLGHFQEAIEVFGAAIALVRRQVDLMDSEPKQRLLVALLSCVGEFYHFRGDAAAEEALAIELITWGQQLDDLLIEANALKELAYAAEIRADYRAMYTYSTQAVTLLAGQKNAEWLRVNCLLSVSIATIVLGLFDEGMQSGLAALSCLAQAPNCDLEANINLMLGINCQRNKNYGPAQHYLTTARDLGQSLHNQRVYAFAQCHLGDLHCDLGDYGQAKPLYEELFTLDEIDYELDWRGWLRVSYGRLLHLSGDLTAAQSHYQLIVQQADQPHLYLAGGRALLHLGGLLTEVGEWAAAATVYQRLQTLLTATGLVHLSADLHAGLATLYLAQQQWPAAQEQVTLALAKLAAHSIAASEEPFLIYWRCICVLTATNDAQAPALLDTAYTLVQTHAAAISDGALRQTFLTKVAAVVAIIDAATRGRGTTTDEGRPTRDDRRLTTGD